MVGWEKAGEEKLSVKYLIRRLSARAVLGYAREDGDHFSFYLDESATRRCVVYGNNEQEDNALFYQTMYVLHGGTFPSASSERIRTELSGVIFYMDFAGIFDRADPDRQKKAESLFRPEGVTLDFGSEQLQEKVLLTICYGNSQHKPH